MTQHGHEDSTSGSTADQGRGVVEQAKGAARDVMSEARAAGSSVRQEAAGLGSTIKQGLSAQVDQQKKGIADRIGAIAERTQRAADDLRDQEAWLGNLLGRGARELEHIASDIRDNDMQSIIGSAEGFARRQPALFMGAAVALGFALTRVVRAGPAASGSHGDQTPYRPSSSRPEPYTSSTPSPDTPYAAGVSRDYAAQGTTGQGTTDLGTVGSPFENRGSAGPVIGGSNI